MFTSSSSQYYQRSFCAALGLFLCLVACTKDQPPAPSPAAQQQSVQSQPAVGPLSLSLAPREPNRKNTLLLTAEGADLREASVAWYVNGALASSRDPLRFDCADVPRGSSIRAVVTLQGRESASASVTVANTPPELTEVSLMPVRGSYGDSFEISATAVDLDGDKVTVQYAWTVNGVLAGNSARLERTLKRGDVVRVEAIPNDGRSFGTKVELNQTIGNHPPVFVEHQNVTLQGGTFTYQAQATDQDDDRITFALEVQEPGLSIDPGSGRVTWIVPSGFTGERSAVIIADDGHGGRARYSVTFTVKD